MVEKQKTIARPVSLKGKGLHTGLDVTLTFRPAPENFGCKFKRVDFTGQPVIDAHVKNVFDTSRGTAIKDLNSDASIGTIEHVMSAIYGLQIDNILIEVNAPESPIMDGSSRYFVDILIKAGIIEQNAEKRYFEIKDKIVYTEPERGVEIIAFPDDKFSLNVLIDYNSPVLVNQYATLDDLSLYKDEIAKCRTFVFLHDLERLLKKNLIKGGDLENAIVLIEHEVSQEELNRLADLFNKPRVEVKPQGILNNLELYYNNEPARHKLLDFLGDLSLVGRPIKGKIIANRPGHSANYGFVKLLSKIIKKEDSTDYVPRYDLNSKPLLDINQIRNILPHRPPFLLVDKILEVNNTSVVGLKNVTMNEEFFRGHFPDNPVMPGVLIIEAMAQVGGILVLSSVKDPENYLPFFMKIDKAKFRKQVFPGDIIIFKLTLVSPIRRGIAYMKGKAFVGDTVVTEAELMAQIIRKKR